MFLDQIETIMNDFIQLKPQSNVFEAETMVEGKGYFIGLSHDCLFMQLIHSKNIKYPLILMLFFE